MALPGTITYSTVGEGTVDVSYGSSYDEWDGSRTYKDFTLTGTPSPGWQFDRLHYIHVITYSDGHEYRIATDTTGPGVTGPLVGTLTISDNHDASPDFPDYESGRRVSDDWTVTVYFTHKTSTVSVVASPSNAGTVSGGGTFNNGSSCTIVATPYAGYAFVKWTSSNGLTVSSNGPTVSTASHTFTVDGDVTWTAHFTPKPVWVVLETNYEDIGMIDFMGMASDRRAYEGQFAPSSRIEVNISSSSYVSIFCFNEYNIAGGLPEGFEFDHWVASDGRTYSSAVLWLEAYLIRGLEAYAQTRYVSAAGETVAALVYTAVVKPKMSKVKIGFDPNGKYSQSGRLKALRWNNGNIPWFEGSNPYDFASMVRVVKDTPTEYEAEVPYFVYATVSADGSYNFFPDFGRRNTYTYGFWYTFVEGTEVPEYSSSDWWVAYWWQATNPRDWYWEYNLSSAVSSLRSYIYDFSPIRRPTDREYLELLFHIEPYNLGKLLCTGTGEMLCDSSGRLMHVG